MASTIALLVALAAYTSTVVVVNTLKAPDGAEFNFDIYSALNYLASHPTMADLIPAQAEPLNMVLAGLALIIPALVSFWIVSFIVK